MDDFVSKTVCGPNNRVSTCIILNLLTWNSMFLWSSLLRHSLGAILFWISRTACIECKITSLTFSISNSALHLREISLIHFRPNSYVSIQIWNVQCASISLCHNILVWNWIFKMQCHKNARIMGATVTARL